MKYRISHPTGIVSGTIQLPSSKSESNRALIVKAIGGEGVRLSNLSSAKDTQTLIELIDQKEGTLDVGPAGTTMRFLTALRSVTESDCVITGSDRMKQRPIGILVDALRSLGADISYLEKEGYPPLSIKGKPLAGGRISINGGVSSQFISALLLVAPALSNGLTIVFEGDVISRPYIQMTLNMLQHFGIEADWVNEGQAVQVNPCQYDAGDFMVESDWSGASYWFEMMAFAESGNLELKGLKEKSWQGDSAVVKLFEELGVSTVFRADGLSLTKTGNVSRSVNWDFIKFPDLAQTLMAALAGLGVEGDFVGLRSLRIKETDRSLAMQQELAKVGIELQLFGDDRVVVKSGKIAQPTTSFATYHDHRMAMALAPLALLGFEVEIEDPEVVVKSYPTYWDDLRSVGFEITAC